MSEERDPVGRAPRFADTAYIRDLRGDNLDLTLLWQQEEIERWVLGPEARDELLDNLRDPMAEYAARRYQTHFRGDAGPLVEVLELLLEHAQREKLKWMQHPDAFVAQLRGILDRYQPEGEA